jgi:hypothetical protein
MLALLFMLVAVLCPSYQILSSQLLSVVNPSLELTNNCLPLAFLCPTG